LTDEQQTPAPLLELIHPAERTEARLALMALMQGMTPRLRGPHASR
jgi:hypothetical protein